MNEHVIVALVALTGFLILAVSGIRSRRLSWKSAGIMAAGWLAIFAAATLFIGLIAE